jgi:hypothetical protein
MRVAKQLFLAGWIAAMAGMAPAAAAQIIFDNFGPGDTYDAGAGRAIFGDYPAAPALTESGNQFRPDAGGFVQSVALPVFRLPDGSDGLAMLHLYADAAGRPGTLLESASFAGIPAQSPAPGPLTEIRWSGATLLEADTSYWLTMSTDARDTALSWQYTATAAAALPTAAATRSAGEDWTILPGSGGEVTFRVAVAPVPEPSSLALWASCLAVLGWRARRPSAGNS